MQRSHPYGKPAGSGGAAAGGNNINEAVATDDSQRILDVLGDEFDDDRFEVPLRSKVEPDAMKVDDLQKLILLQTRSVEAAVLAATRASEACAMIAQALQQRPLHSAAQPTAADSSSHQFPRVGQAESSHGLQLAALAEQAIAATPAMAANAANAAASAAASAVATVAAAAINAGGTGGINNGNTGELSKIPDDMMEGLGKIHKKFES